MIKLRIARLNDCGALSSIYKHYVNNTSVSFENMAPNESEFKKRIEKTMIKYPFLVAEYNNGVVGYAYASEYRTRAAYQWTAELSVYVAHEHIGEGVGTCLYSALLEMLKQQNICTVCAGITYPNERSVYLHEKLRFIYSGKLSSVGYKNGKWHDLMWYVKQLSTADQPSAIIPFPDLDHSIVSNILNQHHNL